MESGIQPKRADGLAMHVIALVAIDSAEEAAIATPLGASRFLSLLPEDWNTDISIEGRKLTVYVRTLRLSAGAVRSVAEEALTDPTLHGWRIESCLPI